MPGRFRSSVDYSTLPGPVVPGTGLSRMFAFAPRHKVTIRARTLVRRVEL